MDLHQKAVSCTVGRRAKAVEITERALPVLTKLNHHQRRVFWSERRRGRSEIDALKTASRSFR
jgi:hypothetical protein